MVRQVSVTHLADGLLELLDLAVHALPRPPQAPQLVDVLLLAGLNLLRSLLLLLQSGFLWRRVDRILGVVFA